MNIESWKVLHTLKVDFCIQRVRFSEGQVWIYVISLLHGLCISKCLLDSFIFRKFFLFGSETSLLPGLSVRRLVGQSVGRFGCPNFLLFSLWLTWCYHLVSGAQSTWSAWCPTSSGTTSTTTAPCASSGSVWAFYIFICTYFITYILEKK